MCAACVYVAVCVCVYVFYLAGVVSGGRSAGVSLYADSLAACDVCCVCCGQCSPLCRPTTRSQVSWSEVCTHCFREKFCISSPSTVAAWVCSCVSLTVVVLVSLRFGECTPACLPACMHACVCVCACVFFHLHLRVIVHRVIRYEDVPIFHVQPTIIPVTLPPPNPAPTTSNQESHQSRKTHSQC